MEKGSSGIHASARRTSNCNAIAVTWFSKDSKWVIQTVYVIHKRILKGSKTKNADQSLWIAIGISFWLTLKYTTCTLCIYCMYTAAASYQMLNLLKGWRTPQSNIFRLKDFFNFTLIENNKTRCCTIFLAQLETHRYLYRALTYFNPPLTHFDPAT